METIKDSKLLPEFKKIYIIITLVIGMLLAIFLFFFLKPKPKSYDEMKDLANEALVIDDAFSIRGASLDDSVDQAGMSQDAYRALVLGEDITKSSSNGAASSLKKEELEQLQAVQSEQFNKTGDIIGMSIKTVDAHNEKAREAGGIATLSDLEKRSAGPVYNSELREGVRQTLAWTEQSSIKTPSTVQAAEKPFFEVAPPSTNVIHENHDDEHIVTVPNLDIPFTQKK